MTSATKLPAIVERYNQGCRHVRDAQRFFGADALRYESAMRRAVREIVGALELALKAYLRNVVRPRLSTDEQSMLRQPTFNDMMVLMKRYADPAIDAPTVGRMYDYRDARNDAEHDAAVPPMATVHDAAGDVRRILIEYLAVDPASLGMPITADAIQAGADASEPDSLRHEYFAALCAQHEYVDLGGISPRVGSQVVRLRLADIFVPPNAWEEVGTAERRAWAPPSPSLQSDTAADDPEAPAEPDDAAHADFLFINRLWKAPAPVDAPTRSKSLTLASMLERPCVVLLGDPGSGKTTVARFVAWAVGAGDVSVVGAHLRNRVPILVRAADFATALAGDPTLSWYDYLTNPRTSRFAPLFRWAIDRGTAVLLIDGLDEARTAELRVGVARCQSPSESPH